MIYRHIEDIPYPFLHDAVLLMDKYTEGFKEVGVDPNGGCAIILKGELTGEQIKRALFDLDPNVTCKSSIDDYKPECFRDFNYLKGDTLIYTKENIDYRTL